MSEENVLDLSGLKCPMPIVELTKRFKKLEDGDEIVAIATDPAFCLDIEAWCNKTGNELLDFHEEENQFTAKIKKKS